jgi:hypothetical protein
MGTFLQNPLQLLDSAGSDYVCFGFAIGFHHFWGVQNFDCFLSSSINFVASSSFCSASESRFRSSSSKHDIFANKPPV